MKKEHTHETDNEVDYMRSLKPKNKAAQDLVKLRWEKTTKEQRIAYAKMMNKASQKVRRAKKFIHKRDLTSVSEV